MYTFHAGMPSEPTLIPFHIKLDAVLMEAIDKAVAETGLSRAHFIRIAVWRDLEKMGIHVDKSHIHPPSRSGKGGALSHKKVRVELNEPPHRYTTPGKTTSSGSRAVKPKRSVA